MSHSCHSISYIDAIQAILEHVEREPTTDLDRNQESQSRRPRLLVRGRKCQANSKVLVAIRTGVCNEGR